MYKPNAVSLAAELSKRLGVDAKLVKSAGEVFEVEYGGELLFSKRRLGRFPETGEVLDLVKKSVLFKKIGDRGKDDREGPGN